MLMAWIREVTEDLVCGAFVGIFKGLCGYSLYTAAESEEIDNLKKLALSIIDKAPPFETDPNVCEAIIKGQKSALDKFCQNASPEMVSAGVVTASKLVCGKAFKQRFGEVLMGACANLVGCKIQISTFSIDFKFNILNFGVFDQNLKYYYLLFS